MTLVIAHRGSKGTHPENTLIAFEHAVDIHADGIELDVQLSKDKQPVIIHDKKVNRTTNGKGKVKDLPYPILSKLTANKKHTDIPKQSIPLLSDVLNMLEQKKFAGLVNVELKNKIIPYKELEEKVISELYSIKWSFTFMCSSFNYHSLVKLHDLQPDLSLGFIYKRNSAELTAAIESSFITGLHPSYKWWIKNKENPELRQKEIRPWKVNKEAEMTACFEAGLAGFHTDFPEKGKKIQKRYLNDNA